MDTCELCGDAAMPRDKYAFGQPLDGHNLCRHHRERANSFVHAYMHAALWASTDVNTYEPLDRNYNTSDFTEETSARMAADCWDFIRANEGHFAGSDAWRDAGHEFWLTRNHHGAGFWDSPDVWGDATDALTAAAHAFPEVDLFYIDSTGEIEQFRA